jgi:hypothetical protein
MCLRHCSGQSAALLLLLLLSDGDSSAVLYDTQAARARAGTDTTQALLPRGSPSLGL